MNEEKISRPTKTKEKCPVCYGQIYEGADPAYCVHDEERGVLGSMFSRAGLIEVARGILKQDDFDIEEHRVVYEAMLDLFEQRKLFRRDEKASVDSALEKMGIPPDPVFNLHLWLEERGEKIPLYYLVTLHIGCVPGAVFDPESSPVPATDVIAYYAYMVKRKAIVRNLRELESVPGEKDRFRRRLEAIDERIRQTQTYWLVRHEKEESEVPLWYSLLRPELRPTGERINTLETLRAKYEIPHEVFWKGLASYPGVARLLQINLYKQARQKWPSLSEKDLLKSVFIGRALKPEPYGYGMTPEEFERVMENINSLQELCDYVVRRDSKEPVQQFNLCEWETYVEMLKKAGIGTEIDWERHKSNVLRMRRDNIRASIYGIMGEEARVAMEKVKDERGH